MYLVLYKRGSTLKTEGSWTHSFEDDILEVRRLMQEHDDAIAYNLNALSRIKQISVDCKVEYS